MNKFKALVTLISLAFLTTSSYTQILENFKPQTPILNEQRNAPQAQLHIPSDNVKPTIICLCCSSKNQEPLLWIIKIKNKDYILDAAKANNNNLNP